MIAKKYKVLICLILLSVVLSHLTSVATAGNEVDEIVSQDSSSSQGNTIKVTQQVILSENYRFYDTDNPNQVIINISSNVVESFSFYAVLNFPLSLMDSGELVEGLPEGAYYSSVYIGYPPVSVLSFYFPYNSTGSSIRFRGYFGSGSLLWRNLADIYFLNVTTYPEDIIQSRELIVVFPAKSDTRLLYSPSQNLVYQTTQIEGKRAMFIEDLDPKVPVITLYEPNMWQSYAIALMFLMIFTIVSILLLIRSGKITFLWHKMRGALRFVHILKRIRPLSERLMIRDSSRYLMIYVLCGIIMISLCFAVGPDPRTKVYVLVQTKESFPNQIEGFLPSDVYAVTIFDEMTDLKTLTDIGMFKAIIVGDFDPPSMKLSNNYIFPALETGPEIILLKQYDYTSFYAEVQRRFGDKTVVVDNELNLERVLNQISQRRNSLGLNIDTPVFMAVSAILAVLSFVIVFMSYAFFSSKILEIGEKPGFAVFIEGLASSILVFTFNQLVYVVCSVLLAVPLGLHASSPKVTVIGILGFGGGSVPRMLIGILGILFGVITSTKRSFKIDKVGILALFVVLLFILLDPLTNGLLLHEFILLFLMGSRIDYALSTWSNFRSFLDVFTTAFGSWVSPTFNASLGITLYYAGATLLCLLSKAKKTTATVLLFFSALCIGQGGIRVAEMTPWRAIASVIPGTVAGFSLVIVFFAISLFEGFIRKRFS